MRFTRRPRAATRPLAEIIAEAQRELATNPTIMVSTFDENGVEHRRRANPWSGLNASFRDMGDAIERFSASVERAAEAFRPFVEAAQKDHG
ncbi:hypothetical protein H7J86_24345 [Mycobacterium hackensackense]|uniref:hypothetical protein n=1 Tax=Mycobacterium hackensackense TaxID=228909 RepID=UPI002265A77C|nr:hypothetical protein [Mycobacterium hackensackense]MCV7255298.1 hypothetical protein [Mycobacterium hackensackense]